MNELDTSQLLPVARKARQHQAAIRKIYVKKLKPKEEAADRLKNRVCNLDVNRNNGHVLVFFFSPYILYRCIPQELKYAFKNTHVKILNSPLKLHATSILLSDRYYGSYAELENTCKSKYSCELLIT